MTLNFTKSILRPALNDKIFLHKPGDSEDLWSYKYYLTQGYFFLPDLVELTFTSEIDLALDLGNYGNIIQVARGKCL